MDYFSDQVTTPQRIQTICTELEVARLHVFIQGILVDHVVFGKLLGLVGSHLVTLFCCILYYVILVHHPKGRSDH